MTIITEITKPTITIDGETGVVEVAVQGEQGVDAVLQAGNRGDFTVSIASNGAGTAVINSGAIDNDKVASDASIDGSKINPNFGSQNISTTGTLGTGDITISKAFNPSITFNDGNNENDFEVSNAGGLFRIRDIDAGFNRFTISSASGGNGGVTSINNHLEIGNGLDVTGQITGTSHIDLPDNALIKLGDNDEFEIFHNSSNSNSIIRETGGGILSLQTNGSQTSFWDSTNQVLMAEFNTGGSCTFRHGATTRLATTPTGIAVTGDITSTGSLTITHNIPVVNFVDLSENPDYRIVVNSGQFKVQDTSDGNADRLIIEQTNTKVTNNLEVQGDLDVNGNISLSGTVDSVNIAARDTLFGALTSSSGVLINGVTATTQSELDNSSKIATTSYVDTAVSSLVDSAPGTLNTLNELAEALGDDANFSTTVTNSIADKLSLAGGTLSGDLTILKQNSKLELNDPNTSDPNYAIRNDNGIFSIHDSTNSATKIQISKTANELTIFPKILANGGIELQDNDQIQLGSQTGGDCKIYHSGTNGYINNSTGDFIIKKSNNDRLTVNASGVAVNGTIITNESLTINNNAGELYFYDATETNLIGFLRGTKAQGVDKFEIITSQNNSEIRLVTRANTGQDQLNKMILTADDVRIGATMVNGTADDNDVNAIFKQSGATELYFNGAGVDSTKVFETVSTGVDITGAITATVGAANARILSLVANMGNNNNRELTFSAPDNDSGSQPFTINTNNSVEFEVDNARTLFIDDDGAVNLHHDGSTAAKLSTTATGITVDKIVTIDGSTPRIEMKVTADEQSHRLEFYNTADSIVSRIYGDPSTGNLEIQTGADGNKKAIKVNSNGAVDLYFDGGTYSTPKLSTLASGVVVNGELDINSASYARTMYQFSGTNMWSVGLRASASGDTNYHIYREAGHTGEVEIGAKINANGGLDVTSQIVSKSTTGTGSTGLKIDNSNETFVQYFEGGGADATFVMSYTGSGGTDIRFKHNGEISLNHAGQEKLKTSSTGVAVTGKATMTESNASTSNDLRKITTSTSQPSGGNDGDIWIVVPS